MSTSDSNSKAVFDAEFAAMMAEIDFERRQSDQAEPIHLVQIAPQLEPETIKPEILASPATQPVVDEAAALLAVRAQDMAEHEAILAELDLTGIELGDSVVFEPIRPNEPEIVAPIAPVLDEIEQPSAVNSYIDDWRRVRRPRCFRRACSWESDDCKPCRFRPLCGKPPRTPAEMSAMSPYARSVINCGGDPELRREALARFRSTQERRRIYQRDHHAAARAAKKVSPPPVAVDLSIEAKRRLILLKEVSAVDNSRRSPLLRQLKGRMKDLFIWWLSREKARKAYGPKASLAQIAAARGDGATRKQAQNRMAIIAKLELPGEIWS